MVAIAYPSLATAAHRDWLLSGRSSSSVVSTANRGAQMAPLCAFSEQAARTLFGTSSARPGGSTIGAVGLATAALIGSAARRGGARRRRPQLVRLAGDASPGQGSATETKPTADNGKVLQEHAEEPGIGKVLQERLDKRYDLVILGGGPTGLAAAQKAACLGRRVLVVDKPKMAPLDSGLDISFGGPTGLFSKALRDVAKTVDVRVLRTQGLDDDVIWMQIRNSCIRLASMNAEHQVKSLKAFKVDYLQANATVLGANNVLVMPEGPDQSHKVVWTSNILVASGSRPMHPRGVPFDGKRIFDSDSVNNLMHLPKSVVIAGAGIIAIEYAKIMRKLGADVTMLVRSTAMGALQRVGLDVDVSKKLLKVLEEDDVKIYENTMTSNFDVPTSNAFTDPVKLTLVSKDGSPPGPGVPEVIECDIFLGATGRNPTVTGFGLEELSVELTERRALQVDENYQTSLPGVYGAGDVVGPPALASTGVYQAQTAVEAMFDEGARTETQLHFPVGMWTTPECGYYGLTKEAAEKKGMPVEEGVAQFDMCLRGRVFAPEGLLKLVFRTDTGVVVGVHIIGADACELVHYGMDLVEQNVTIFKICTQLFTAVTFHELFKEAAIDGNSKLEFGLQWHSILNELGAELTGNEDQVDENELREKFNAMDSSGDGSLDEEELAGVFKNMGLNVSKGTVANLMRLADDDGNGTIEFDEFSKIFEVVAGAEASTQSA